MAQYPFVMIFFGSDRLVHFMTYTDERRYGQCAEKHIGQGLIDFIELDLTAFAALLAKAKAIPLGMENYQTIRNLIFDVAETLQGTHRSG